MSLSIRQAAIAWTALALLIAFPSFAAAASPRTFLDSRSTSAADPIGTLTLERAHELTAAHHPALRAAAWRLRAASARRHDAGRLPNPALSLDMENVGGDAVAETREATLRLVHPLEIGGDRTARARVAQATETLAEAEFVADESEILAAVTERYLESWALQERVTHLRAAERLAAGAIAAAAERFRAGAGPALEQARAEALAATRRAERLRAAAELVASRQRLAALWGSGEVRFDSLALPAPANERMPPPERLHSLIDGHPRRARAAAEVTLEEARVREATAARVPDLDLSAGVRQLGAGDATTFVVGGSLPLPLWNRHTSAVSAARAERSAAEARAQLVDVDLRASLAGAWQRHVAAQESYELVASQVRPKSEEVLRQLESAYRSGRSSSLEFLEGQRALLEAEMHLVDAAADAWRTRLALERILGRSLSEFGGVR